MKKIIFICLTVLAVNSVLIQTIIPDGMFKNIIRITILLISMYCIIIKKKTIRISLLILTYLAAFFLLLTKNYDLLTFVFIFVFVQFLVIIKERDLEKYLLISSAVSISIIFLFLLFGITHNSIIDYRNRMTFGVNGVPFFYNVVYGFFSLLIVYSRKYFRKNRFIITIISIGFTTYFYLKTDVRGGFYSFLILIVLLYIIPKTRRIIGVKNLVGLIPLISIGLSLAIASFSNNYKVNMWLSLRPKLLSEFFRKLSLNDVLFSKSVKSFDSTNIVDNSYLHLLIGGGILITIIVIYIFYKAMINLYRLEKYTEISFIISTCIYFNMESIMVRVENMFVIYFWYLIIKYSSNSFKKNIEIIDN